MLNTSVASQAATSGPASGRAQGPAPTVAALNLVRGSVRAAKRTRGSAPAVASIEPMVGQASRPAIIPPPHTWLGQAWKPAPLACAATLLVTSIALSLAVPADAQVRRATNAREITYEVEFVQATRAGRDAIAAKRLVLPPSANENAGPSEQDPGGGPPDTPGPGDDPCAGSQAAECQPDPFHNTQAVQVHVLKRNAGLGSAVSAARSQAQLAVMSTPRLHTVLGHEAQFWIGERIKIPTLPDLSSPEAQDNPDLANEEPTSAYSDQIGLPERRFGIRLALRALELPDGRLRVRVTPQVIAVDFAHSTTKGGRLVPALAARGNQFSIDIHPGQPIAITGLLNKDVVKHLDRIPGLDTDRMMKRVLAHQDPGEATQMVVLVTPILAPPSTPAD